MRPEGGGRRAAGAGAGGLTACHSLHFKQPTSASACPGPLPPLRRFQAVLHTQAAGQASLRVVENNDFKQLPHLTLALRPGSDAALKQFLAFRLGELRSDCSQLSAELERTQVGAGWGGMGAWRIALKGTGNSDGSLLVAQRQWETLSTWPAPVPICPVCDLRRLPSPTTPAPAPALQSERNSLQNGLGEARRALAAARELHERHALEHEAEAKAREAAVTEAMARELSDLREASLRCGRVPTWLSVWLWLWSVHVCVGLFVWCHALACRHTCLP